MASLSQSTTLYLSTTAQSQLKAMMSANEITLGRLNTKKSEATSKNNALDGLQSVIDNVQKDVANLSSLTDVEAQKTAISKLATDYSTLMTKLSTLTGKDGALNSSFELRGVRSSLRTPFGDSSLYDEFAAAGLKATSTGLEATTSSITSALSAEQITNMVTAFNSALTKLESATTSYESNLGNQLTKIGKDIVREQARVDVKNKRTEANFLKMYQVMQEYSASQNGTSSTAMLLSGLTG